MVRPTLPPNVPEREVAVYDLLLVEDSPTQALKLKLLLQESGYRVTLAADGEEGLELLAKRHFPIVVTDWVMPRMDGAAFCREIRARNFEDYTYILLLTGKSQEEDVVRGFEAGADDYLVKPPGRFELIARLKAAARVVSLEASLKERNREVLRLTLTDTLTGVNNRRFLDETLPKDLLRALRYGHTVSLIMSDLDRFKRVNDTYGHLVGDQVLCRFAEVLRTGLRQGCDWVARFGGEEFVVALPETDAGGALAMAERLRQTLGEIVVPVGSGQFGVTASFGIATADPEALAAGADMEDLLRVADVCLYQAKETGRDRCVGRTVTAEEVRQRHAE